MGYMDFLEQRIIIIPPGMWSFLPHWLSLDFIGKNRRVPKLLQTRLPPADALTDAIADNHSKAPSSDAGNVLPKAKPWEPSAENTLKSKRKKPNR